MVHGLRGDSYLCCNNNVDGGTVIESTWAVEGGSVTELGGSSPMGTWSWVGEIGAMSRGKIAGRFGVGDADAERCSVMLSA
jgi:hypothetical protein